MEKGNKFYWPASGARQISFEFESVSSKLSFLMMRTHTKFPTHTERLAESKLSFEVEAQVIV